MEKSPSSELQAAYDLFKKYLPKEAEFEIDTRHELMFRATYTSKRTGRKLTVVSKGTCLPTNYQQLRCHLVTIALTPAQQGKAFSRLAFYEKRARQEAFLFGGGKSRGNDVRVNVDDGDNLTYRDYTEHADYAL